MNKNNGLLRERLLQTKVHQIAAEIKEIIYEICTNKIQLMKLKQNQVNQCMRNNRERETQIQIDLERDRGRDLERDTLKDI